MSDTYSGISDLRDSMYQQRTNAIPISTDDLNFRLTQVVQQVDERNRIQTLQGSLNFHLPESPVSLQTTGAYTTLPDQSRATDVAGGVNVDLNTYLSIFGKLGNRQFESGNGSFKSDRGYGQGGINLNVPLNEDISGGLSAMYDTMQRNPVYNMNVRNNSGLEFEGSYDPNTREKVGLINYTRRF